MSAFGDMRHALSATRSSSWRLSLAAVFAATALGDVALAFDPATIAGDKYRGGDHDRADGEHHWVGTWATSPQATNAVSFNNQTLRMIVRTSSGGHRVRVQFSNAYGTRPLVIGAARIALRAPCTVIYGGYVYNPPAIPQPPPPGGTCPTLAGSAIVPGSDRVLTFGGSPSTKIWNGAVVVSDPVDLDVPALADLAVSFYLPDNLDSTTFLVTRHGTAKQTSYISARDAGDLTAATVMPGDATLTTSWYFLSNVDVLAFERTGAIVALGDSLTDANVSTQDTNSRWPYELARRLNAHPGKHQMGVLDHGTGGDRVVWDAIAAPIGGNDSGLRRFDRDVIGQPGVTHVIVLLGVNDLRNTGPPPDNPAMVVTPEEMIDGYKQMILRAHAAGIKIFGGTLIPWWQSTFTNDNWTLEKWERREAVNAWVRTSGAFDAVIDFDKCLADPSDPRRMLAIYDSGDHLHANDLGYNHMGECIDLSLFREDKGHH